MTQPSIWNPTVETTAIQTAQISKAEEFSAIAGQSLFTLTEFTFTPNTGAVELWVNGAYIRGFTEPSASTIQLPVGLSCEEDDIVVIRAVTDEYFNVNVTLSDIADSVAEAAGSAAAAASSATAANTSKLAATASETNAAASATAAAGYATNSSNSATQASTYATNAQISANAASISANAAATKLPYTSSTVGLDVSALTSETGLYLGTDNAGWLNKPAGGNATALLHLNTHSGAYYTQLFVDTAANSLTIRSNVGSGFGSWATLLSSSNFNSYAPTLTGVGASGTWGIAITGSSASCTGNAATATTLQTAQTINGTSFNGSAAITTATWGTARTITLGATGKSVNGSAAVSWTLAEMGAAPLYSAALTGTPTAPTAAAGTNTTQIATTAFVTSAISATGVTTSAALSATAGAAVGAVGTYALLYSASGVSSGGTPGSTYPGSSLRYTSNSGVSGGSTPAGTWRLMGTIKDGSSSDLGSVWLRIS